MKPQRGTSKPGAAGRRETGRNAGGAGSPTRGVPWDLSDGRAAEEGPIRPEVERLIAAFAVGRLLNRLGFFLQQAFFFPGPSLGDAAREVARSLGIEARKLADPEGRDRLQAEVIESTEWVALRQYVQDHADNLATARGELDSPDRSRDSVLVELLLPVTGRIAEIRRSIRSCLDAREERALRLGELLDQAVCPPDIYRHLFVQDDPEPGRDPVPAPPGSRAGRPASTLDTPLVNVARRPGEIEPRYGWLAEIRQLVAELGVRVEWPGKLVIQAGTVSEEDNGRIAASIRDGLSSLSLSPVPLPEITTERLTYDRLTKTVVVDGREYCIEHPVAARIFEVLFNAGFTLVPTKVIKEIPGCKGRHDKIIRRHLKDLAHIIGGKGGQGGGYWLRLPAEKSP